MDKTALIIGCVSIGLVAAAAIVLISSGVAAKSALAKACPQPAFPIDVVCLWVDGADAAWRTALHTHLPAERAAHQESLVFHTSDREPAMPHNPHQRDELYYSAHSVLKFMPWVRTYYLVTMRPHKPAWWPANGRMGTTKFVLVHHDEIFDGQASLPTFNSNAIQRYVSRIPRLAEHFILFDDDCYVGQPLRPQDFFSKRGAPRVRMLPYVPEALDDPSWRILCANTARIIRSVTGDDRPVMFPSHVATPTLRSVWSEVVFNGLCKEASARFKRFRSGGDFTINYVIAGIMHGTNMLEPLPEEIETAYANPGQIPSWPAPHLFCINSTLSEPARVYLETLLTD